MHVFWGRNEREAELLQQYRSVREEIEMWQFNYKHSWHNFQLCMKSVCDHKRKKRFGQENYIPVITVQVEHKATRKKLFNKQEC